MDHDTGSARSPRRRVSPAALLFLFFLALTVWSLCALAGPAPSEPRPVAPASGYA